MLSDLVAVGLVFDEVEEVLLLGYEQNPVLVFVHVRDLKVGGDGLLMKSIFFECFIFLRNPELPAAPDDHPVRLRLTQASLSLKHPFSS